MNSHTLSATLDAASPDYNSPDFNENTAATTFHTTGTTGLSTAVFFRHDN